MYLKNLVVLGATVLLASPLFGSTYYGGVEDWTNLDNDYNDVVFSISGQGVTLNSSGQWFSQPALGTSGSPFWNHSSLDGPNDNIGYCIYGGGTCNGGSALSPGSKYLAATAANPTGSANDVTFGATGSVQLDVILQNTAAKDMIGWYALSDPGVVNWLNASSADGTFVFNPGGLFGLVAKSQGSSPSQGYTYYSQKIYGSIDNIDHFAFFTNPASPIVPEPASIILMVPGLLAAAVAYRRKRIA